MSRVSVSDVELDVEREAPPVAAPTRSLPVGPLKVAALAVLLLSLGLGNEADPYRLSLLTTTLVFAIAAVGLYYAYSVGGMFAFGQAAMMGLGAYTTTKMAPDLGFVAGVGGAILVTAVVSAVLATMLRKAQHMYFAVGTLAFAELAVVVFQNWDYLGGERAGNLFGIPGPELGGTELDLFQTYLLVAAITVVVIAVCVAVNASPLRRNALAAKNNPMVAESAGVRINSSRVQIFVFASTLGGLAGALQAHTMGSIAPESYGVSVAIDLFLMVLLGGAGSLWGAMLGALFLTWLPEYLRPIQEYETVVYSVLLLATIVLLPKGILGGLSVVWKELVRRVRGK